MLKRNFTLGGLVVAAGIMASASSQAQPIAAGTLTCEVAPGVGLVVGSRKEVTCTFQTTAGRLEVYDGVISKLGVDIGVTQGGQVVWGVLGTSNNRPGALAGRYIGGTAQATVGAGVGANALVGGSRNSFTLQPLSVSTQTGFNVAAGVADLTLQYRPERPMGRRG